MSEHQQITPAPAQAPAAELTPEKELPKEELYADGLGRLPVQKKLSVGAPDDPLEKEADEMADRVMRMPQTSFIQTKPAADDEEHINRKISEPFIQEKCSDCEEEKIHRKITETFIQKKCAHCEEEEKENIHRKPAETFIQKKESGGGDTVSDNVASGIESTRGGGQQLDTSTRSFMESGFGADFSSVNIHTGGYAAQLSSQLNAQAFTVGNDIYFNEGKFNPSSSEGKHLLAHELTHTVQQTGGIQKKNGQTEVSQSDPEIIQRIVEDDKKFRRGIKESEVISKNLEFWEKYNLASIHPIRDADPNINYKAYANRTYEAQLLLTKRFVMHGHAVKVDGVLGPRTIMILVSIAINDAYADLRYKLKGIGFDFSELASAKGIAALHEAESDVYKVKFLAQWDINADGETILEHFGDEDSASTTAWMDDLIFGGPAPASLVSSGFSLGDRFAILKKAYKGVPFTGRIAIAEAARAHLDQKKDNHVLSMQNTTKPEGSNKWIAFKGDRENTAQNLETWFGITYPDKKTTTLRKTVGLVEEDSIPKTTGLLISFYIPASTPVEMARIAQVKDDYLKQKADNIDDFIQPRMQKLISLTESDDSWYIVAFEMEQVLDDFWGREAIFEKMAGMMESNAEKNYFEALVKRALSLKRVDTLQTLVQLCNQTRFKTSAIVIKANEILNQLKHDIQSHDYVTGAPEQQGVWINKGRGENDFLKVGDVTKGMYRIKETRERIKEDKRKQLQAKMEEIVNKDMTDAVAEKPRANPKDMTEKEYMENVFERAAQDVKISKDDIEEVSYEQAFRLKGVRSKMVMGVKEFSLDYERVARMGGEGNEWEVTEASSGYRSRWEFENDLGWYKFSNTMKTLEKVVIVEAVIMGGVVLLVSGAGGALIAIAGGAKMVAISIAISVLIWAITAEHHTLEGFLMAVLTGYLMAVGLKFLTPAGAGVARWIGTATFRQKLIGLVLQSIVVGGGSGAFTNVSTMLVEDILNGKLRSAGDYLKGASFGFLLGAMFELGGSLLIGPAFRAAGRNVLERITNAEALKEFIKKAGIIFKPAELGGEVSKSFARFVEIMNTNIDKELAAKVAGEVKNKAQSFLSSFAEGFELTVHRQALDLIEAGMTKESVTGLEKLIAGARAQLDKTASRAVMDDVLNQLVKDPQRINPFFGLVKAADENLMKLLLKETNLNKLATSDGILSVARFRPAPEVNGLLQFHFDGGVNNFETWAQRLLKQTGDSQKQILDLLESRGASVTPESVIRIAESGTALSTEVVDGLTRMVSKARGTAGAVGKVEEMLRLISNDKMESFLKTVGKLPKDEFDKFILIADDPAMAGRLVNYTNDAEQLVKMLEAAGNESAKLDSLIGKVPAGSPNASNEIEALLNRYPKNIDKVLELTKQVNGDAAILERSMVKMGKKEVEEILAKAQSQAVTKSDPASMQRFLKMAEKNSWVDPKKIEGFIERIHKNQAQPFKHTYADALDRLQDFVTHHSGSSAAPPVPAGHGPMNLASADSIVEITLSGGAKVKPHAKNVNLQHYHEGHTFENFWFDPAKIDRAGTSTFWPPGTADDVILKDLVDVLSSGDCKTMIERDMATGYAKSPPFIDTGGTKFQIGMDVPAGLEANMFFPYEGARAIKVSKHILHGVKDLLGL